MRFCGVAASTKRGHSSATGSVAPRSREGTATAVSNAKPPKRAAAVAASASMARSLKRAAVTLAPEPRSNLKSGLSGSDSEESAERVGSADAGDKVDGAV